MKLVSRRSFLKISALSAAAVAGAALFTGCSDQQILVPVQFADDEIGADAAAALNNANLKVVYSTSDVVLNKEILTAVKTVAPVKVDWNRYCIARIEKIYDGLDGQEDHLTLKVHFALAML